MRKLSPLPIDDVLPRILQSISSESALVLQADPGAGKTTRVPPALLDAGLADLADKRPGQIVVLQPRRVAARAAASRISVERGGKLGAEVGYQVRFDKQSGRETRILFCTEGIFLRRLQDDPFLDGIAVVIFDEFHERSIDSDLALAMVRQIRTDLRPDLKLLVMSATLDTEPIAKYLGGCPQVSSPGRTFPLEIEYLQFPANEPIPQLCSNGVSKILGRSDGHILVFLPGIGEIRQTETLLDPLAARHNIQLLPLYGDMPLEDQQRVLEPSDIRKIVLATNVAETSLTIDGVTCVVDSGMMRVNQLDSRLGLNRLQLAKISKASADQRAGRAARTAAGTCLRLWSEREHQMLSDFQAPEITCVELSQCLLQLLAWGEKDLLAFPWFEPPPAQSAQQALQLLERLDAIDRSGSLTELGKQMSKLPVQPRIARLLLEGKRYGVAQEAAICAALLSERDPFRRKEAGATASHHSNSDVLDRVLAIEEFAERGSKNSLAGELLPGPARQILKASEQLLANLEARGTLSTHGLSPSMGSTVSAKESHAEKSLEHYKEELVLRSLLAAFPDRVCKRRESRGRRGVMVGGRGVRLSDSSAVDRGDLFLAVELLDIGQSELLVTQASELERDWLPEAHLTSKIDCSFDAAKERVIAFKRTKFLDLTIDEMQVAVPKEMDAGSILASALQERSDLETLVDEEALQYFYRVQILAKWLPELQMPEIGIGALKSLLPDWCAGCASVQDLKSKSLTSVIQSRLSAEQQFAVEQEAPARITVPSGSKIKVEYKADELPVVAVRIQEVFGLKETPRLLKGRVGVLLHLLSPNYQVQQITPDLLSFWKNTYQDVKKDFRRRYPKHSWPDDPLTAQAERRPQRKRTST